jgi:hypothetical protein
MRVTRHKKQSKKKMFTVNAAAKSLSVTRWHLSRVIHGHRISPTLLRRYLALKSGHAASGNLAALLAKRSPKH